MFDEPVQYHGHTGDDADPEKLTTIDIGYFAPQTQDHPRGLEMWRGASLAVEIANEEGGYEGKPFRLVDRWSDDPWRGGSEEVMRLVYEDLVWAILGGVDGETTHVAEQVATKARIPLVSPIASDPTLNYIRIPWMFRLAPGDDRQARIIAEAITAGPDRKRTIVVSSTSHDDRVGSQEMLRALTSRRCPAVAHCEFDSPLLKPSGIADRIRAVSPDAMVLWCGAEDAMSIIDQLTTEDSSLPLYVPFSLNVETVRERAVDWSANVIMVSIRKDREASTASVRFTGRFQSRYHTAPSDRAAYGYDAANLVVAAIRSAGLNRVRIRDAIARQPLEQAVIGPIVWDNGGGNTGHDANLFLEKLETNRTFKPRRDP